MPQQNDQDLRFESVILIECNIDDMTGEALGYVLERLMEEGALDAWFTPIYMKKGRPGILLSVLCRPDDAQYLRTLLLRETSTLGVRWSSMDREVTERHWCRVETRWGAVRTKVKSLNGQAIAAKPEYEDCARLAREHGVPLADVQQEVLRHAPDAGTAPPPQEDSSPA